MHLSTLLLPVLTPLILASQSPQHIFSNPDRDTIHETRIPTSYESAILARRILHLSTLGTLSTVFPHDQSLNTNDDASTTENRPHTLSGMPTGLMDYIADCETSGNPTILAISIATSFRNVAAGSNITLSLQWTPPHAPKSRIENFFTYASSLVKRNSNEATPLPYSAANLPRFSLHGYLEKIPDEEVREGEIAKCFTRVHSDAKYWLPGNSIHKSEWVRLVVEQIYWIGGFGDRAYIGWIDVDEWRNVTEGEWKGARLQGEKKGWKEWSLEEL